jgi:thiosulfate reductase cytochrome b subunit
MGTTEKIYFYPLWLRIWHGFNALGIITLIITGISMQSSIDAALLGFNTAVNLHNIAGILVLINYLLFFTGNLATGNGKYYLLKVKGFFRNLTKQGTYYAWGMFHGQKSPFPLSEKRKFNPLQKFSYLLVMYFAVPIIIITGIALLFPEMIIDQTWGISGVFLTAILHSAMGFLISVFLIIHLYTSTLGKSPLDNFKAIISGWHHL